MLKLKCKCGFCEHKQKIILQKAQHLKYLKIKFTNRNFNNYFINNLIICRI